jgi:hypothetical protein
MLYAFGFMHLSWVEVIDQGDVNFFTIEVRR